MFHGQIEREFSDGEPWSAAQQCKLPNHLQLLADREQEKRDIWEFPNQQLDNEAKNPKNHKFWGLNLRFWASLLFN